MTYLDFEKSVADLEAKIAELKAITHTDGVNILSDLDALQQKVDRQLEKIYSELTAWQRVKVARHPDRPHFVDYIDRIIEDFIPIAGDRRFGEDEALIAGFGRFRGRSVAILGQEKGFDTASRMQHNFGSAKPEGYRKAQRLMDMADRFGIPVISLVDTAGAFPGQEAEQRGQAEAIAAGIEKCLRIKVPFVSVIIGEGGSGGAIAIATADKVFMLANSVYSVISPEGCASILWRSAEYAADAADALKMTADDLLALKIIDGIIAEPVGGAHRHKHETIDAVAKTLDTALNDLLHVPVDELVAKRAEKFLAIGR